MISKILLWLAGVVGAVVLLAVVAYFWLTTGEPTIDHDYLAELNAFIKPEFEIKDEENAATFFDNAAEVYSPFPEQEDEFEPISLRFTPLNSEHETLVRGWIEENKEAMELWEKGCTTSYYWKECTAENNDLLNLNIYDNLSEFRQISIMLYWRGYLKVKDGDVRGGFDDILTAYRGGIIIKNMNFLIEQLVGNSILTCAVYDIRQILNQFDIERDDIGYLRDEFETLRIQAEFIPDISCERYLAFDEIQRSFVVTPIGEHWYVERFDESDEVFFDNEPQSVWDLIRIVLFPSSKQECIEDTKVLYSVMEKYFAKYPYEIDDFEAEIRAEVGENFMASSILPSFGRYLDWGHNSRMSSESIGIILAAFAYEMDNGYFPESLDEMLESGHIEEVPMDPFSGKPIIYRKDNDSFLLYSIGADKVDDNGTIQYLEGDDSVLFSLEEGCDSVFWPVD